MRGKKRGERGGREGENERGERRTERPRIFSLSHKGHFTKLDSCVCFFPLNLCLSLETHLTTGSTWKVCVGEGVGGCRSTWFFSLPGYYGGDVASWLPTSFVVQAWKASQAYRSRSKCLHVLKLQNLSLEQCRQLIKSVFLLLNRTPLDIHWGHKTLRTKLV